SRIPQVARFMTRRAVDADALDAVVAAMGKTPEPLVSMLEGLGDGLEGRFDVVPPRTWPAAYNRLTKSHAPVARLAQEIAQRFGDAETTTRNLQTLRRKTAPLDDRRRSLQVLAAQRRPQLVKELPALVLDQRLRVDAIRAIAAFDDDSLGKLL